MGLYHLVFGHNPVGQHLVAFLLDVQEFKPGRLRDAWVEQAGESVEIRLHTRNGGGNRPDHAAEIESMRAHPWFVRDADMAFDKTYADFYFRVDIPGVAAEDQELATALVEMAVPPVDMSQRWKDAIDAVGKPT